MTLETLIRGGLLVDDLPGGGQRWVQDAGGIEGVWVNGELTLKHGQPTRGLLPTQAHVTVGSQV